MRGTPALVLTTTAFERLAQLQANAMGYPDLRLISVPHPLRGLAANVVVQKVPGALSVMEDYFRK